MIATERSLAHPPHATHHKLPTTDYSPCFPNVLRASYNIKRAVNEVSTYHLPRATHRVWQTDISLHNVSGESAMTKFLPTTDHPLLAIFLPTTYHTLPTEAQKGGLN